VLKRKLIAEKQEGKTDPVWRMVPEAGGGYKERMQRMNGVEILHTHVLWENETC
jgi:hypothetical protein